jgi:hypothetical protein
MNGQALRIITSKAAVLPALLIPPVGFGRQEVTWRHSKGPIITDERTWAFELSCGCKVSRYEDCASPCASCRAEIEAYLAAGGQVEGYAQALTSEQVAWMATPCRLHAQRCQQPFCFQECCLKHCGHSPDGLMCCQSHCVEKTYSLALQAQIAQQGILRHRVSEFWRSLFLQEDG